MGEGLKQTEVGIIPKDWNTLLLSEIADFENGKAHEQFINDKGDYIVVNSKFISTEGKVAKYSKVNLCPLTKGNIAIVMSDIPNGKELAKCFLVEKNNYYTLNQRIGSIKPHDYIDTKYLYYKLNRNKYYLSFDSGSGQTNLKKKEIEDCIIPLPPTKAEQTAIATVLSDTDQLISQLEQLIAKKRNIKTGAMQELLRPKVGWEVKKLGEIVVSISSGKSNTQTQKGCYPIYGSTGIIGWKGYFDYEGEKILIARVGANAGILNKVSGKYLVSDNTLILSISTNIDIDFLYFVLKKFNLNSLIFGSGQPLITGGQLKELEITFPKSKEEQTRIAQILSDMDSEIQELERQLAKYRMAKQGMMQSLLTGKIRLPLERIEQTYNQL